MTDRDYIAKRRERSMTPQQSHRPLICLAVALGAAGALTQTTFAAGAGPAPGPRVNTTIEDFFLPGSQPDAQGYESFRFSDLCQQCHEQDNDDPLLIYPKWQGSMMAHSARDPLFYACLAVANQDAAFVGDLCIRCHTPSGWISGRSTPTDASALILSDLDGVNCSVCHRMVDPDYKPGVSPSIDFNLLNQLQFLPDEPGGGNFVLDRIDNRRGPYDDALIYGHAVWYSPFHKTSELCANCHDVSNPAYLRRPDGTYALTQRDQPHPTGQKHDMFPLERTYSEWLNSDFADGGVDMGGRFGGNKTLVSTCQDCHMPDSDGEGCNAPEAFVRHDLPAHEQTGANAWMLEALITLCDPGDLNRPDYCPDGGFVEEYLLDGRDRALSMLSRAMSLDLAQAGNYLHVRVTNETGHKLPSGYPEGRRMWINVVFRDDIEQPLAERGRYDPQTADLINDTKIYEIKLGLDAAVASLAGLDPGESFHFALNNVILKDSRIPPRGFANAAFRAIGAAPAAYHYTDGQYWDVTRYRIPQGAASAAVTVRHQIASKEFVTFLRDENHTNDAGDVLYDLWERTGKSPPAEAAVATLALLPFVDGDFNENGVIELFDYAAYEDCSGGPFDPLAVTDCAAFDFDADGDVDLWDFAELQINFEG